MANIFQLPPHKRFNYKPRFYNQREELRKERQELIKKELEAEKNGNPTRITKDELANYIKLRRKAHKKSNLRILIILAILLLLFYFFLFK
ncbi:MAG: hypothetical protein WCX31_09040 [Salinivirgaceae bacterium]|jgi:hypothetical protein